MACDLPWMLKDDMIMHKRGLREWLKIYGIKQYGCHLDEVVCGLNCYRLADFRLYNMPELISISTYTTHTN